MNPSFHFAAAPAAMQAAAKAAAGAAWPALRPALVRGLGSALPSLQRLAAAHSAGEVNDDALQAALRSEQRALAALLVPAAPGERAALQAAAHAALQVLQQALAGKAAGIPAPSRARARAAPAAAPPATPTTTTARTARATAVRRAPATPAAARRLNARADTVDFRDLMYTPTLVEVGTTIALATYREAGVPVLDQGSEGACTDFGLATVVHYLLRRRQLVADKPRSARACCTRWLGATTSGRAKPTRARAAAAR